MSFKFYLTPTLSGAPRPEILVFYENLAFLRKYRDTSRKACKLKEGISFEKPRENNGKPKAGKSFRRVFARCRGSQSVLRSVAGELSSRTSRFSRPRFCRIRKRITDENH